MLVFDINVSHGSVATRLRCDGIFHNAFIAKLPLSLSVKEFWKSVNIWRSYIQNYSGMFFWLTVYIYITYYCVVLFSYIGQRSLRQRVLHVYRTLAENLWPALAWARFLHLGPTTHRLLGYIASRSQKIVVCICLVSVVGPNGLLCLLNAAEGNPKLDLDISSNSFNCDCKDYQLIAITRYYVHSHWLDRTNCEEPTDLYGIKVSFGSMLVLLEKVERFWVSNINKTWKYRK